MQLIINALTFLAVEIKTWMSNYIPLFHVYVVTYSCLNSDAGLANIPSHKKFLEEHIFVIQHRIDWWHGAFLGHLHHSNVQIWVTHIFSTSYKLITTCDWVSVQLYGVVGYVIIFFTFHHSHPIVSRRYGLCLWIALGRFKFGNEYP